MPGTRRPGPPQHRRALTTAHIGVLYRLSGENGRVTTILPEGADDPPLPEPLELPLPPEPVPGL